MGRDTRKPRVSERLDTNQNIRNRPPPSNTPSTVLDNDDKHSNFTQYRNRRVTDNKKPLSVEENNNLPSDNEEEENGRDRDVDKASTASCDSGSFSEPELPLDELSRLSIKPEGTLTARSPIYGSVTKNHRIDPYNGQIVSQRHACGGGIVAKEPWQKSAAPLIWDSQLQMYVSVIRNGDLPQLTATDVANELGDDPFAALIESAQNTLSQHCEPVPTTVQEFCQPHGSPPSEAEYSPLSWEGTLSPVQNYEYDSRLSSNYYTDSTNSHSFENKKVEENINRGVTPDRGYESESDEPDSPQSLKGCNNNYAAYHSYTSPQHQSSMMSPISVALSIADSASQSSSSYLSPPHTTQNYTEIRSWPDIPKFNPLPGRERIINSMNPEKKAKAWALVNSKAKEQLLTPDEDGDTELMKIMANGVPSFVEVVYALVEWLHRASGSPQLLAASNKQGHTALYLACKNRTEKEEAVVVRYLAETLIELNCFMPEQMFEDGNTLLHIMAKGGDKSRYIMAELLSLRNPTTGKLIFDVNRVNNEGYTPLHVASYWHDAEKNPCFAVMKLLQQQGGNISTMEAKGGNTVLHLIASQSCDPSLFRILLENTNDAAKAINQKNYNEDTPLHLVAANNMVTLSRQKESYRLLLQNGAQRNLHNKSGKPPLALVTPERKAEIKSILNPKRTFC